MSSRENAPAIMWIRDGVLINRMPLNAVAFAAAYFCSTPLSEREHLQQTDLVNFAFAQSGKSCLEKVQLRSQLDHSQIDIQASVELYNALTAAAASSALYFDGALDLLAWLKTCSVSSFITSAVEQEQLDLWSVTDQGQQLLAPSLVNEILGRRAGFIKGQDHFRYVYEALNPPVIFYVADAEFEIAQGRQFAANYSIETIGFANCISSEQVIAAAAVINVVANKFLMADLNLEAAKFELPSADLLEERLRQAGAKYVVRNFSELRNLFEAAL